MVPVVSPVLLCLQHTSFISTGEWYGKSTFFHVDKGVELIGYLAAGQDFQ